MNIHESSVAEIDRLFVEGPLPEKRWQALMAHLHGCEECKRYYERASRLSFALGRSSLGSGNIEAVVVGAILDEERRPLSRGLVWLFGVVAAAALLMFFVFPSQPKDDNPLHARGGANQHAPLRLRPLCSAEPNQPLNSDTAAEGERVTACSLRGDLLLTYLYDGAKTEEGYLFIVGFDRRGFPLWYTPKPNEKESALVKTQQGVQRLPGATRLGVNHIPGRVRVFAILSDSPVSVSEVEQMAQSLRESQVDISSLRELPLHKEGLVTSYSDLEVSP